MHLVESAEVFRSMVAGNNIGRVLLVDDDELASTLYERVLRDAGFLAYTAPNLAATRSLLEQCVFDAVLLDWHLTEEDGAAALPEILRIAPTTKVFMLTAHGSIEGAVDCMRRGASGFFTKSMDPRRIVEEVAAELSNAKPRSGALTTVDRQSLGLIGDSKAVHDLTMLVEKLRGVDSTVLILGESGTGKEVLARAIHQTSQRASDRFIAINCGAIPEQLLESELFGHRRGSFTDAKCDRKGIFESCSSGTLLLDEIGDMPMTLQTKLLRVLQEKQVTPIGASMPIDINTRVIAATHRDISEEARCRRFREDLYYRLSVVVVRVPPLRERVMDIPALAAHFLTLLNERFGKEVRLPSHALMARMCAYSWPGNIRELQNAIERAVVLATDDELRLDHIFQHIHLNTVPTSDGDADLMREVYALPLSEAKQRFEKAYLQQLLKQSGGNISEAARISGRYRADIYRLMNRYGFDKSNYR